jgi:hypothetical protein
VSQGFEAVIEAYRNQGLTQAIEMLERNLSSPIRDYELPQRARDAALLAYLRQIQAGTISSDDQRKSIAFIRRLEHKAREAFEKQRSEPIPTFFYLDDVSYRKIVYRNIVYFLTKNQSKIIKYLYDCYVVGHSEVEKSELREYLKVGGNSWRPQDSFEGSPLWGTLIVTVAKPKGSYRLNI